jgi:hypothetical protein
VKIEDNYRYLDIVHEVRLCEELAKKLLLDQVLDYRSKMFDGLIDTTPSFFNGDEKKIVFFSKRREFFFSFSLKRNPRNEKK